MQPAYKQTEIGVIPKDWDAVQLSEVADLQVGFAFKSEWFGETVGTRLLRGENVGYGRADWSETRTLKTKSEVTFRPYMLNPGDVVIGMDRTFTHSGSKISILHGEDCPCLLVQRVGRFIPRKCDNRFLWFVLSSAQVQSRLRLEQKGMDIPHLSRTEILQPMAAFPPLPEQRAIAEALSDVDGLLGRLDRLIAKKRDLKQAAIQQLLTGQTRLPGFQKQQGFKMTEVGLIPVDWDTKRLGDLGNVVRGGSPRPAGDPRYFDGDFMPWLTVAELTNIPDHQLCVTQTSSYLTKEGSKQSRTLPEDTLIIANSGATLGIAKLLKITCCANDGIAAIINQQIGDKRFISFYINSQTKNLREVVATGNGQPNLNTSLIQNIKVPYPDQTEQCAISEVLTSMDAELSALEQRREKTRALKQAMMQELLTGRIRLV